MEALIETSVGKRPSLADVEEFRLLAKGMTDLDAYSVLFSDLTLDLEETLMLIGASLEISSQELLEEIRLQLEHQQQPLLRSYQVLAAGQGKDDNGLYMALVLVHTDSESAEDNIDLLRQRILETSSLVDGKPWETRVDSMEIWAHGRVLLARLYGDIAGAWVEFFVRSDLLLAHE